MGMRFRAAISGRDGQHPDARLGAAVCPCDQRVECMFLLFSLLSMLMLSYPWSHLWVSYFPESVLENDMSECH